MIDPDVPKLRKSLVYLQTAVRENRATPLEANMALGKLADSLVADRVKRTPVRFVLTPKGEASWLPTY